jgi:hypothetical protein
MLRNILIAGGGTAGWLCACYLAKTLDSRAADSVRIALVESPAIGILGVGEGTFPSIRGALSQIGISESRFIRETGATFKQGIDFVDWVRPADSAGHGHYFHPFNLPSARVDEARAGENGRRYAFMTALSFCNAASFYCDATITYGKWQRCQIFVDSAAIDLQSASPRDTNRRSWGKLRGRHHLGGRVQCLFARRCFAAPSPPFSRPVPSWRLRHPTQLPTPVRPRSRIQGIQNPLISLP